MFMGTDSQGQKLVGNWQLTVCSMQYAVCSMQKPRGKKQEVRSKKQCTIRSRQKVVRVKLQANRCFFGHLMFCNLFVICNVDFVVS